jgi:SHS2 domain-containing protein
MGQADDGVRTRDPQLGKLMLYQLSYVRAEGSFYPGVYEWVEHTAELELRIEGASAEEAFADATAALGELLGEGSAGGAARHTISVEAFDAPALLAEYLEELVFLAETRGFVPERLAELEVAGESLRAVVEGRLGAPPPVVKAVTYHRLSMAPRDGRWHATVVLDV